MSVCLHRASISDPALSIPTCASYLIDPPSHPPPPPSHIHPHLHPKMSVYKPPTHATLRSIPSPSAGPALILPSSTHTSTSTISHSSLLARVSTLSHTLLTHVSPLSTIAIVMPNTPHYIISFLATVHISCTAAPLNPAYTTDEYTFSLTDAHIDLILLMQNTPSDAPIRLAAASASIPTLDFPPALADPSVPFQHTPAPPHAPTPDTRALFLHTSGTTSRPKGVPLTHANLCVSLANIASTYELTSADRSLLAMPLFHVHGLMAATLTPLSTAGAVILPPEARFAASSFWKSAHVAAATWYTAVPTMHQILLARADRDYIPCSTLRFVRSCSAALAPSVLEKMERRFGVSVLEAYAMTEASHQMTSNPLPKNGIRKPGSVGKGVGVCVAILGDGGAEVERGGVGEVCIRGENVTKGYANASANESAFVNGWFRTGDQGKMDADGYVFLTGRLKELINRGGEKISPLEIDGVLLGHCDVRDAVCFGVKDEKYGEAVEAAVIPNEGCVVEEEALKHYLRTRVVAFKVPSKIYVCDDFPRTATGKVQRRIVAKHFERL